MRKLLILLFAAAVVGIVISNSGKSDAGSQESRSGSAPKLTPVVSVGTSGSTDQLVRSERAGPRSATADQISAQATSDPGAEAEELKLKARPAAPEPAPAARPSAPPKTAQQAASSTFARKIKKARELLEDDELVEARRLLTPLYLESSGKRAQQIRKILEGISRKLVFNPRVLRGARLHIVQPGESLSKIGRRYGVNWRMISRLNRMDPDETLRVGQKLKVLDGEPSIVVWKSEFRLVLLMDGQYVKEYAVGIGKDDRTPAREFEVDNMLVNPRWYKPGGGVVEYGEEGNLLGDRWIGFSNEPGAAGFGIHGTDNGKGVGQKSSNGCLRMRNADVRELYDFVVPGTRVEIRE